MLILAVLIPFGTTVCIAADLYSQSALLTINMKNKTVKEVFSEIERNSEYVFFYHNDILDTKRRVHLDVNGQTVDVILNKLFEGTDNHYLIKDRQISITRREEPAAVKTCATTWAGLFSMKAASSPL